uniref:Uncharacterized LOC114469749 n=1 Tax=Gouania willdenowi TaxID=441366 RepID=A0A8C5DBF2_GOUWI
MFSSKRVWIALLLISVMGTELWVSGRPLDSLSADERPLRTAVGRCAELAEPWLENVDGAPGGNGTVLQLHVRPFSTRTRSHVFPGKPLFSFIQKVYRCCQERVNCRNVKGIQGRDVDFVFTPEILSLTVRKAELHVHLSNPQGLDIHPVLPFIMKNHLPTRYRLESRDAIVELRVDLLFLIQTLQEAAVSNGQTSSLANMRPSFFFKGQQSKKSPSSGLLAVTTEDVLEARNTNSLPTVDLGLVLGCTQGESRIPCGCNGVKLLHTPFIAIYYR